MKRKRVRCVACGRIIARRGSKLFPVSHVAYAVVAGEAGEAGEVLSVKCPGVEREGLPPPTPEECERELREVYERCHPRSARNSERG
jgi:hypothetical protein